MPGLSHPARNVPGDPVVSELRMIMHIIWSAGGRGRGNGMESSSRGRAAFVSSLSPELHDSQPGELLSGQIMKRHLQCFLHLAVHSVVISSNANAGMPAK